MNHAGIGLHERMADEYLEIALRLGIAVLVGGLIGAAAERVVVRREAGTDQHGGGRGRERLRPRREDPVR